MSWRWAPWSSCVAGGPELRPLARAALLVSFVLTVLVTSTAPASAHAYLVSSNPTNGASLPAAPSAVTVVFSESITLPHGASVAVRVGGRDVGGSPSVDGARLTIPVRGGERGVYIVTWRVISSDTHAVSGSIQFGVGVPANAVEPTVPEDDSARPLEVFARLIGYAGLVALAVIAAGAWAERRTLLAGAGGALIVGAAAIRLAEDAATRGAIMLESPVGYALGAAVIAAVATAASVAWPRYARGVWVGVAAAALSVTIAGHAAADGASAVLIAAVHGCAAALWLAAIIAVLSGKDGRRWAVTAVCAVGVLVITGVLQAAGRVRWADALGTTTYGRLVLAKIALTVLAAAAGGFVQWRRSRATTSPAGINAETTLVAVAFGVAGVLAATPVASATYRPSEQVHTKIAGNQMDLTVTPARPGTQQWVVRLTPERGDTPPVQRLTAVLGDGTRIDFPIRVTGSAPPGSTPPTQFMATVTVTSQKTPVTVRLTAEIDQFTSEVTEFSVPLVLG